MSQEYSQDNPQRVNVRNLNKKVKQIEDLENSKKPLTDAQKTKVAGAAKARKELETAKDAADQWEATYGIGAASAPAPAPAPAPAAAKQQKGKEPAKQAQPKAAAPAPAAKKGKAGACPPSWLPDESLFAHDNFPKTFAAETAALQTESPYNKKARNATKLLNEITALKEKQASGQTLTDAQVTKTKRGAEAQKDIDSANHANQLWIHAELLRREEFRTKLWNFHCSVGGAAPAAAPAPAPKKEKKQQEKQQQQPKEAKPKEEKWEKTGEKGKQEKKQAAEKAEKKAAAKPAAKPAPKGKKGGDKKDDQKKQQQQKKEEAQLSAAAKAAYQADLAAVEKKERNLNKKLKEIEELQAKPRDSLNEAQVKKAKQAGATKKELELVQLQIQQIKAQL